MKFHLTACSFLLLCAILPISLLFFLRSRHGKGLPPGPPVLHFLVMFLALRPSLFDIALLLRDLHGRYGPVICLRLFRPLVFVADRHLAHRILIQGGATFADRSRPVIEPSRLFTSDGRDIGFSSYGPYWRLLRRNLAAEALHPVRVGFFGQARRWAVEALLGILHVRGGHGLKAVTVKPLMRSAMFELMVYMCFAATLGQDELDEMMELQLWILRAITGFSVFAFFPAITKRLFRKRWTAHVAVRRRQEEIFIPLIHAARHCRDPPCYADSLLALRLADDDGGNRPLTDAEMVSLCSEFLNGGTDTTVTLLEWIMAELVNHPDVQSKLFDELVCNLDLNDGELVAMPYLNAVVLEGLRLHPPGHFVLPHGVQSDAEIGGYKVPKGAEVNFLHVDFGRDERAWTDAREFRPERFLNGGEGIGVDITGSREIKMMPFGAGRRMCPGYSLGVLHVEQFVARLVREFEWLPAAEGEVVNMTEKLDITVVMKNPLRARLIPRGYGVWLN